MRANPKISGTKHNVFGIQTGVAIAFFVKRKGKTGATIHYARRPEMETAEEKLSFLSANGLATVPFDAIQPDRKHNWINQTSNDWDSLMPLVDKSSKVAGGSRRERTIFRLFSRGLATQRDEWVYDHDRKQLVDKTVELVSAYDAVRQNPNTIEQSTIKWDRELERYLSKGVAKTHNDAAIVKCAFRPFVERWLYFDRHFNAMTYQLPAMFGSSRTNAVLAFLGVASSNPLAALVVNKVFDLGLLKNGNGGTQGVSRWRYADDGTRLDNITDWALQQFRAHYETGKGADPSPLVGEGGAARSAAPGEGEAAAVRAETPPHPAASRPPSPTRGEGKARAITKDAIFHYVYAVLHDPAYREKYALNLKREFPRIPFYDDFWRWADWGERLMALHLGYESVDPWPLQRLDTPDEKAHAAGVAPKAMLKADKSNSNIRLDTETQLTGVPPEAWTYRLGNRSALEWILDQYKEKTPRDPTIREKFNTYRFADYKEKVIDLLMRVTRVSVETAAITEAMRAVSGSR